MKWEPSSGYDCIDNKDKKVEIKTRRDSKNDEVRKQSRVGRFGKKGNYNFDYGLYVGLDHKFEVHNIFKITRESLIELEATEKQNRGLHISSLIKRAPKIYPD
jgi:hypothetical protein